MKWPGSARSGALLLSVDLVAMWFGSVFSLSGRSALDAAEILILAAIAIAAASAWRRRAPGVVAVALACIGLRWAWMLAALVLDVGLEGLLDDLAELLGYVLGLALLLGLVAAHGLTARGQWRSRAVAPS